MMIDTVWSKFVGVFLTGIGSSYYHLYPDNRTLVWDRLPMTIAFMALFGAIVGEYISRRAARELFAPLLGLLQHLLAAVAPYLFYRALRQREKAIRAV